MMPTLAEELGSELYAASKENNVPQVKALAGKCSPRHWSKILAAAAFEGAIDVAACCMEQGATVDDRVHWNVINNSRAEPVYRFLVESKAVDINFIVDRWGTMLGIAVAGGRHSMARFLLEKGASPRYVYEAQLCKTILACAAQYSDKEMVQLLLDHGAELRGSSALVFAAQDGKVENVKLLIASGADLHEMGVVHPSDRRNLKDLGTPLHKAVENGHVEVVEALLQAGADPALKDAKGRTATDIAREKGMDMATLGKLKPNL